MTEGPVDTARLLAILLRPGARLPVQRVAAAAAIVGKGLAGDHAGGGRRQITLLAREAWAAACAQFGRELDPGVRRANLVVEGLDLSAAIGRRLRIGAVLVDVLGETRPCELMDDDGRRGLQVALRSDRRGGVYGAIVQGGELRVGDPCGLVGAVPPSG